ncbi:hypothetical protein K461DRAFT_287545 [Myriangium duriaei CBS 260.36]|uniref:U3 small nucleolar RNA-associated protein 6 N-terminal domain-containing protein n=1 Tax=Myriangium duriaei CBS 260.36 TaxID=1168546 RepID=A0A9P4J072_9PEZI|nr:hypothetical protein K461DRAFT_287545 [Myriangium duriaei CBS 260.36]
MAAAASDKARFWLEQSVPELQLYKEKGIFTPAEIAAISSKRSKFEHRINMAGVPKSVDFARYASYEQTLDALRRKRCNRKGIRGTQFAGQKRVFSILERGTRRFPGDLGLWMQYIEFCKQESANAKLVKGLTKLLRMHPTKWELWVWAARHYFETQGDMTMARTYMQRGLRFCERERDMWIQYMKLEMIYVAKVAARRKILKLDEEVDDKAIADDHNMDADEIALPGVTAEELDPQPKNSLAIDDATLKKLAEAPVFSGAIPMAIADAAAKSFRGDTTILEDLFDTVLGFFDVPCVSKILPHILALVPDDDKIRSKSMRLSMEARMEVAGLEPSSADFASAIGRAILGMKKLPADSIDSAVMQVLQSTSRQHIKALQTLADQKASNLINPVHVLEKNLARRGIKKSVLAEFGLVDESDG